MNLPNKLTMMRIAIIPLIVITYYIPDLNETKVIWQVGLANFLMVLFFSIASLTDYLDGYFARRLNIVTTFGKFADPLADKLLVMTALIILLIYGIIPMWAVVLILSREFIVTGFRLVAVENQLVIAASSIGKAKTAITMVAIILLFLNDLSIPFPIGLTLFYVAVMLTVISGIDYIVKNKKIVFNNM